MKYRTLRNLVLAGGGLGLLALGYTCGARKSDAPPPAPVVVQAPPAVAPPPPAPPAATPSPASAGLRDVDRAALALLAKPCTSDKIKDGSRGRPFKINVYSDDKRRWNRLKIDLDRDEVWDESWSIKPDGRVERKAPLTGATRQYSLVEGSGWRDEGAASGG